MPRLWKGMAPKGMILAAILALSPAAVWAAGEHGGNEIPSAGFSFANPIGTFDRASAQRGAQVYLQVCANCHSLHQLSYRNLTQIGLPPAMVEGIAASVQVDAAPNDAGVVEQRPGRISDRFRAPFANENAARNANAGALPPDLSVMVKAREGGADYLHALLVGYEDPPAGVHVPEGMHYNKYFPGGLIGMPRPLNDDQLQFADGTKATTDQMSHDVATFLAWAAEPNLETRRSMGIKVVIFLVILTGLAYAVKRKVWADLH